MSNSFSKKVGYEHTQSQDLGASPELAATRRHSDAMLLAVYQGRLSRSEFHEGQVPLKASGSCSWCWYSSRHIQRVVNIVICRNAYVRVSRRRVPQQTGKCATELG